MCAEEQETPRESELGRLFRDYSFIMSPVRNENGEILAADFFREGKQISARHGSSNIMQHLADSYRIMLSDEDKAKRQPRTKQVKLDGQSSLNPALFVDPLDILAKGIAIGALPLSLTDNVGFVFIVKKLFSGNILPSRRCITRRIDNLFDSVCRSVKDTIADCRSSKFGNVMVSACTDMWTSRSKKGHLGINVSLLDNEFVLRTFPISCVPFDYPHTAERIAQKFQDELRTFSIDSTDLIALTTDNESSILNASMLSRGPLSSSIC